MSNKSTIGIADGAFISLCGIFKKNKLGGYTFNEVL